MGEKYLIRAIRTTLFVVFICQLLSTVERQVFDFLGYMWAPIIGNFFQIIAVILGLFGAYQHYRSFVVVYVVWSLLWLGWNIFVICLYMEVGILKRNRERYILTIGTESKSWWLEHGIGCEVTNDTWEASPAEQAKSSRPIPPEEFVQGCVLHYYYVEVIHAAVQVLLALVGLVISCVILHTYLEEEDASASPANDELEFVKIRNRSAATNAQRAATTTTTTNFDNLAFDSDNYEDNDSLRRAYRLPPPGGPRPYEQPPSYDTTMRNTASTEAETRAANLYYASDRQSVRSKASTRSKRSAAAATASGYQRGGNQASSRSRRSTRSRGRDRGGGPQDLPWVQITPSTSGSVMDGHSRHYP
ncbi:uncharacterized protein LOC143290741 [Babylonia areolata]|uniref:uncharacterized protein LOC143290741 n=1 Tax=Babylonia areolata TaxID=304850 RepID=UPI003FD0665D